MFEIIPLHARWQIILTINYIIEELSKKFNVNLQPICFSVIVQNANLHIFGVCWPFGTQVVNNRRHDPPTCVQTSCQSHQACSYLQEKKIPVAYLSFFPDQERQLLFEDSPVNKFEIKVTMIPVTREIITANKA